MNGPVVVFFIIVWEFFMSHLISDKDFSKDSKTFVICLLVLIAVVYFIFGILL